jgi:hypothetical protein
MFARNLLTKGAVRHLIDENLGRVNEVPEIESFFVAGKDINHLGSSIDIAVAV